MRAAIYVRVSTDEQAAEGYSIDAQKMILEDYCIAEGWDVTEVYVDDGFSGRNTNGRITVTSERDRYVTGAKVFTRPS